MKLKISEPWLWHAWMLAGLIAGVAFSLNVHFTPKPKQHLPQADYFLACYTNVCFS